MPAEGAAPRPDARAILRAAGALDARFRVRARLDGDYRPNTEAYRAYLEAANPAAVAALCERVIALEHGLYEWQQVVQVEGWGKTPKCRGCGASPIFTGEHPCAMPAHAPGCWVAAILGEAPDARP